MTAPIAVSGASAAINGLSCLRNWKIIVSGTDTATSCSAAAGGTVRGKGNSDFHGVAVGYGHTPAKLPGETFTFSGMSSAGKGWTSSTNGAIVQRVKIIAPILEGEFIYYELHFAATGSIAAGAASVVDTATVAPFSACGLGITIDGTLVPGVIRWALELDGNITEPSWQSDSVIDVAGNVWPVRRYDHLDAMVQWSQRVGDTANLPVVHSRGEYGLQVSSTLKWNVKWCRLLGEPVEYPVANPGGRPGYITAEEMTAGWTSVDDSGTKGSIVTPAISPVTVWPV